MKRAWGTFSRCRDCARLGASYSGYGGLSRSDVLYRIPNHKSFEAAITSHSLVTTLPYDRSQCCAWKPQSVDQPASNLQRLTVACSLRLRSQTIS